ncbi:MAG TPA: radical SAM protein [Vicinamibacterales bacterium]|nr:radical SAM protein [Vicinamibacterales bacterium]
MSELHTHDADQAPAFRLDVRLHDTLMQPAAAPAALAASDGPVSLPEAVFPHHPELLSDDGIDYDTLEQQAVAGRRPWTSAQIAHAMRRWAVPYLESRVLPGDFHPILTYLFTEWKCNLDCGYCWAYENRVKGMTEEVARRAIDWLLGTTGRVLALMGGEVLLRPRFAHQVIDYATQRGFWVYLPTNGRLMRPEVIDRVADAGIATVNLAVDALDVKPGLPKALAPIRTNFDYLIRKQYRYGYTVFLNMCITRTNLDDIRQLTELAHDHGIATDYHIVESPMTDQPHYQTRDGNDLFIRPEDFPQVDALIDWLIDRQRQGYRMANSVERLSQMKAFLRGGLKAWNCRAGQNSLIIRTDGTLAPCFPMYSATYDWGTIEWPNFDRAQLDGMKQQCQPQCFSTLNHILAFCYNDARVIRWLFRQAMAGFQGVKANFE